MICQSMSRSTQVMHSVPPPSAHPLARHSLGTCIRRACCVRQGDGAAQPRLTALNFFAKFVGDVKLRERNRQTPRPRRRLGEKGCELSERRTHRDEPKAACHTEVPASAADHGPTLETALSLAVLFCHSLSRLWHALVITIRPKAASLV